MSQTLRPAEFLAQVPMNGEGLSRDEALEVLRLAQDDLPAVLYHSDRIRRRHRGDVVQLCGIIAAKVGRCSEDCKWCSQSARHATGIQTRDLLSADEMLAAARSSAENRASCFGLVTSGASPTPRELDRLCDVIRELADNGPVAPCASLGILDDAAAARLAAAGCKRYNHNLETSERHFARVVTTHRWADRLATARRVKAAGMQLCCGGLFGIGEQAEDRVDLALAVRDVGADVVPVNFLNPIAGTPLGQSARLLPRECLGILAMMRFVLPTRCIKVAGGREAALRDLQSWMFLAGADGCLAGNYLTTAGRPAEDDLQMIRDLGLRPAAGEPPCGR